MPAAPSDGVFEAFCNGPSPIQTELETERASYYHQSEDCLYLNVWTADGYEGGKRAVMVFIHGGSYGWGGTADPLYDGRNFVAAHPGIVLVTIAYRTGLAGFVDFSSVPGGEEYSTSGNLGILDQICALRYVRDNIAAFGGDPGNVTIFGESAGGGSVSLLPLIPEAKGLFHRVIAESGSVALTYSRKECEKLTKLLLRETKAKSMRDLVALSPEEFRAVNEKLNLYNNFPERDGVVLPEDLYGAYERGEAQPVDMMIGTNADELRYWILDLGGLKKYQAMSFVMIAGTLNATRKEDKKRIKEFLLSGDGGGKRAFLWRTTEFYNELLFRLPALRQAQAHAAHGNPTYTYYWRYPSSIPDIGACHAVELAYVFNNLTETVYTGEGINAEGAEKAGRRWANFAETGDPWITEARWEQYSAESRKTMILDEKVGIEDDLLEEQRKSLFPLTEYRFNGNFTGSGSVFSLAVTAAFTAVRIGIASFFKRK